MYRIPPECAEDSPSKPAVTRKSSDCVPEKKLSTLVDFSENL